MDKFAPHEWDRDSYTDALTCRMCLVHVTKLEQLESIHSCPGPTTARKRELRAEARRETQHWRNVNARRTGLVTRPR